MKIYIDDLVGFDMLWSIDQQQMLPSSRSGMLARLGGFADIIEAIFDRKSYESEDMLWL